LFFVEQDRPVLADNTFSLKNTRFEAPRDLRNRPGGTHACSAQACGAARW